MLAGPALYHLSHSASLFFVLVILEIGSCFMSIHRVPSEVHFNLIKDELQT
jgi:hypothetical protein